MARPGRPVSENYQPICCSVSQSGSYSSEAGLMGLDDDNEHAPIFSISKSSMDMVMAPGPPHKRDPAWTRMHLRRSSSANAHSEQSAVTLQQLHPNMWQHIGSKNSHQLALSTQNVSVHSPSVLLSERRIGGMQRWSGCSGSTYSRSSTPETIVWRGGTSRPSSLSQEAFYSSTPDSLTSKLSSAPTTPSPLTSPLDSPTLPPVELLNSASTLTLTPNQEEDLVVSQQATSEPSSPPQAHNSSPLPCNSPNLPQLSATKDESLLEDHLLIFQFPSPKPSSVSLAEGNADARWLVEDKVKELQGPEGSQLSQGGEEAEERFSYMTPSGEGREPEGGRVSVCQLEQPGVICPTRGGWRSPLVSSLSDSGLRDCCRCNLVSREGATQGPRVEAFREEGTMTSQLQLVDAEVQTITPMGSWWDLKRNTFTSHMGSHSLLGSPPGSRLNLKTSAGSNSNLVGSNSNLVSPSSSMFPVSSGEDEEERRKVDPRWDITSVSSQDMERRRSCLKTQGEERDELGRRGSMKQVQWDEHGMTWDVHGASVDPEVLSTAIQKHLDLQNSPLPQTRSSKKKKAPKPPLISSVIKAMAPELNPNVIISATCTMEGEREETQEEEEEEERGGAKREKEPEVPRRISRAEGEYMREEEEVYEEVGSGQPKSPSVGSTQSRKRSVMRSLRRPGWCGGGSRKMEG